MSPRCCRTESYQAIDPALMGREYRLVLGKHSGRQAVDGVFARMGYLNAANRHTASGHSPLCGELETYAERL
jgi:hypothetical protein